MRDYWTRRISREITRGLPAEEKRLNVLMAWTQNHIRPIPAGWPVMDDHILYTIIRGTGESEQKADVFTTLSSYAGTPSFWAVVKPGSGTKERLILSFAFIEGRWTVWDVGRGISFRRKDGSLAIVSELSKDPALISFNVGRLRHQGRAYSEYLLKGLPHFFVPEFTRPQKQMPGPRVLFELKRLGIRLRNGWKSEDERKFDPQIVFWD